MFERFPYTNLHQLNLDWIIEQLKNLESHAVLSVNGQTGEVVLYQDPDIQFPEVNSNTWRMVRTAGGNTVGIMFQNGLAYIMNGNTASRVYTIDNPPAYPVTSVNGQTGDVVTYNQAYNRLPAVSEQNTNFYRTVDKDGTPVDVGVQVDKNKLERMSGQNRYTVYDTGNTPALVTSVNGQSGAVMIAIPFDSPLTDSIWMSTEASEDHTAGFGRETVDGTVQLYTVTNGTHAEAFIHFVSSDDQYSYTKKLLTTDDIPSSSGVISINGHNGVVVLYAGDIYMEEGSTESVKDSISKIPAQLVFTVNGDSSTGVIEPEAYAYIKNNTHGLTEGYYKNTSSSSFPVSGGTADSTVFTPVSAEGVINNLSSSLYSKIVNVDALNTITSLDDLPVNSYGRIGLDASISPTGTLALFNYICYGMPDYQSILLSSTYSDREWMTSKHSTSWRNWKELESTDQNFRSVTYTYSVSPGARVNTNLKTLIDNDLPAGTVFAGLAGFQSGDAGAVISALFYANNNYSLCINNISSSTITDKTATIYYKCV